MKRTASLILQITTLACLTHLTVTAQEPVSNLPKPSDSATSERTYDAEVELMRQDMRAKRKQIIAANLPLTEAEATKFWPVYDRYVAEMIKINDGRYALIQEYAKNYDSLTDDQADNFIEQWVTFDRDDTQLRLQYIPEFQKVISHKKTAMFFQVDRRVGMMINLQLAGQVPLVKP